MELSPGQKYFLKTFEYLNLNEWKLKPVYPPAANGKTVWQYQKGRKNINSFDELFNKKHCIEKQQTKWLGDIQPPEIEVKKSYLARKRCIKIICPICNHINEHGPSEGHRKCDRIGNCPGYVIKMTDK